MTNCELCFPAAGWQGLHAHRAQAGVGSPSNRRPLSFHRHRVQLATPVSDQASVKGPRKRGDKSTSISPFTKKGPLGPRDLVSRTVRKRANSAPRDLAGENVVGTLTRYTLIIQLTGKSSNLFLLKRSRGRIVASQTASDHDGQRPGEEYSPPPKPVGKQEERGLAPKARPIGSRYRKSLTAITRRSRRNSDSTHGPARRSKRSGPSCLAGGN